MRRNQRCQRLKGSNMQKAFLARLTTSVLVSISATCCVVAHAQIPAPFPDRPLRLEVSFPAGSSSDLIARQISAEMSKDLGQQIVVDNKAGAQMIIGTQNSLLSPSNGYKLVLFESTPAAINVSMFRKLPYDPMHDFKAIGQIGEASNCA
jgi:tripartite-type tricarboxylate transporter receptor subunit TctC